MKHIVYGLLFLIFSTALNASNLESLFDFPKYYSAKLSPDGKYIAVSLFSDDQTALAFLNKDDLSVVSSFKLPQNGEIGQFYWVNNERVVIKVGYSVEYQNEPVYYGELYAINFDGSRPELIFGYRAYEQQVGTRLKKKESIRGWAEIIHTLPNDDKHILISSTPMDTTGEKHASVLLLNVYTGIVKKDITTSPVPRAQFISDNDGNLKAVVGTDTEGNRRFYIQRDEKWQAVPDSLYGDTLKPLTVSADGNKLYTLDRGKQAHTGIYKLDLNTLEYKKVYSHDVVDITDVELTTDTKIPYAIRIDEGYPAYLLMNKKHQEAAVFKSLLNTFPYSTLNITSRSEDGNSFIIYVSSDVNPGTFYLYDKPENKLTSLFRIRPELNEQQLVQMEPIKFEAEDGYQIHGYFTPAANTKGKQSPLVVMVHGGPHGVRDYWGFNSDVQYLATNGFSVLQINYRGSWGYGNAFFQAGKRQWGNKIQQDIYQAYQWLVTQGKASPEHVCIMGDSFGAYSAIQSAINYPNTYKCAIANAGIYDLNLLYEEGDIKNSGSGQSYLLDVLGQDQQQLVEYSPVFNIDKIEAAILLAHGKKDKRAPYEHFERLSDALDEQQKPYQQFVEDKATHGFHAPENKKMYMKKVVQFLKANLTE